MLKWLDILYALVSCYIDLFNDFNRKHAHTVEVTGSNPVPPTMKFKGLWLWPFPLFCYLLPFCCHLVKKSRFLD